MFFGTAYGRSVVSLYSHRYICGYPNTLNLDSALSFIPVGPSSSPMLSFARARGSVNLRAILDDPLPDKCAAHLGVLECRCIFVVQACLR